MKERRRLSSKFHSSGILKKLFILAVIISAVLIPKSAIATTRDSGSEFFESNYDTRIVSHEVYVNSPTPTSDVPDTSTGNHGFMTSNIENLNSENKTFISPIVVCALAAIIAFLVLTKAKTSKFKTANFSKSFRIFGKNNPKIFQKIKNPALLLAVCFGIGVAAPLFMLEAITSTATTGVEKINYAEHDFDADIKNGENPFGIAIKDLKSKTGEGTDFIVSEIELEAETYNPTGYLITIDSDCSVEKRVTGVNLETCDDKPTTDFIGEDAKIPSIKEELSLEEFKKQKEAGWGWSTDGETFYPATKPLYLLDGGTIYFALKSSEKIPSGTYTTNHYITALTNDINDEFAEYTISFDDESETKTFYKKDPGYFIVIEPEEREGYVFKGWSTQKNSTEVTYDPSNKDKNKVTPNDKNTKLYSVWEAVDNILPVSGAYNYVVEFDQSYYFQEMIKDGDDYVACDTEDHKCGDIEDEDDVERRAGERKYEPDNFRFSKTVEAEEIGSDDEEYIIDLNKKTGSELVYVPKLNGYTFLGWTTFDPAESDPDCGINMIESNGESEENAEKQEQLENTLACLNSREDGVFYHFNNNTQTFSIDGSEDNEAKITLTPSENSIILYAVYKLNSIKYGINYYEADGVTQDDSTQYNGFAKIVGTNGRVARASLKSGTWTSVSSNDTYTESEDILATWEDLANPDPDHENRMTVIESLKSFQATSLNLSPTNSSLSDPDPNPQTQTSNISPRNLLAILDGENESEDEDEDETNDESDEDDDEDEDEGEPKITRRTIAQPATTQSTQPPTQQSNDDQEKTEDDDDGETVLFYEDDDAPTYYTKPLGVTEEVLAEESPNTLLTTICIVVLVVSGIGIASIILLPAISKNQSKKKPAPRF